MKRIPSHGYIDGLTGQQFITGYREVPDEEGMSQLTGAELDQAKIAHDRYFWLEGETVRLKDELNECRAWTATLETTVGKLEAENKRLRVVLRDNEVLLETMQRHINAIAAENEQMRTTIKLINDAISEPYRARAAALAGKA